MKRKEIQAKQASYFKILNDAYIERQSMSKSFSLNEKVFK